MDLFLIYLVIVNVAAFLAFTTDFFLYIRLNRELCDHRILSLFSVAGGGVGMLLAFVIWDRRIVKNNIAWRIIAILGIAIWAVIVLHFYGVTKIDSINLLSPIEGGEILVFVIYLIAANATAFVVFAVDKWKAVRGLGRIREWILILFVLLGGSIGGFLAMHLLRHKTRVWYFAYGIPIIFVLQVMMLLWIKAIGVI